jgi:uncharacterized protein DUF6082
VSTLISSVALIGVMIGLLLQTRQVRIGNRQMFKASQAELVRLALEYSTDWVDPNDVIATDAETARRTTLVNWHVQHLQLGYEIRTINEANLRRAVSRIFMAGFRRDWWRTVRDNYRVAANTRRERRFVAIIDAEYQRACASVANPTERQPKQE